MLFVVFYKYLDLTKEEDEYASLNSLEESSILDQPTAATTTTTSAELASAVSEKLIYSVYCELISLRYLLFLSGCCRSC